MASNLSINPQATCRSSKEYFKDQTKLLFQQSLFIRDDSYLLFLPKVTSFFCINMVIVSYDKVINRHVCFSKESKAKQQRWELSSIL